MNMDGGIITPLPPIFSHKEDILSKLITQKSSEIILNRNNAKFAENWFYLRYSSTSVALLEKSLHIPNYDS